MTRPYIPSRDEVKTLCDRDKRYHGGFAFSDKVWIKFGIGVTLAEAAMQQYVYEKADPCIVRVPEVYDSFTIVKPSATPKGYIVMENVEGDDYFTYKKQHPEAVEENLQAIADAVRHIWSLPLPPDATPGPLGKQKPFHRFFSDVGAGRTFDNIVELEDWINAKLIADERPDRVNLRNEQLCICHLNLTGWNVKIGKPPAFLQWEFSGIYPRIFEEHTLRSQRVNYAKGLCAILFGPKQSAAVRPLEMVANINWFGRSQYCPMDQC